ncbi:hypothetical protein HDU89_003598 [Geranomyces variabilis]|nr:hypothetical protein HDU89_003598 [Geranomyces variabilis]
MEDSKISPLAAANAGYIDVLTVSSAVSALVTYSPTTARGQGSEPSEHHVKNELWADIFTKSVKLAAGPFVSLWEMWHLFPGNAGKGSSRSDFSALAVDAQGERFPFLIVESEVNGVKAHKDYLVAASEAVFELNTIVVKMCESEADLARVSIFVGLVADTSISFRQIRTAKDVNEVVFCTHTDCGRTVSGQKSESARKFAQAKKLPARWLEEAFRLLSTGCTYAQGMESAGREDMCRRLNDLTALIAFIRGPICDAGRVIAELARCKVSRQYPFATRVPRLPPQAKLDPDGLPRETYFLVQTYNAHNDQEKFNLNGLIVSLRGLYSPNRVAFISRPNSSGTSHWYRKGQSSGRRIQCDG